MRNEREEGREERKQLGGEGGEQRKSGGYAIKIEELTPVALRSIKESFKKTRPSAIHAIAVWPRVISDCVVLVRVGLRRLQ